MNERLFGWQHAFDHCFTTGATAAIVGMLVLTPALLVLLERAGHIREPHRSELWRRWRTWALLAPLMIGPILLGAAATILAVAVLAFLSYREYARATGLFRERLVSALVVLAILTEFFAVVDNWYDMFNAVMPLGTGAIAALAMLADRPAGYIQRVALGILGFVLLGGALGHLAYFANDSDYRPILILIVLATELNDVFAYVAGKLIGHRKLAPNTSPKKTIGGALGALVLTTLLVAVLSPLVFEGRPTGTVGHGIALGAMISMVGTLGDLVLSSVKRDLGIKDFGVSLPGHGGLLDRFDSLILVAPAVYHYLHYFGGVQSDPVRRIITGQ